MRAGSPKLAGRWICSGKGRPLPQTAGQVDWLRKASPKIAEPISVSSADFVVRSLR